MWDGTQLRHVAYVFDRIDFLPPGKGPVILIMGGIGMLFLSLFAALFLHRGAPSSAFPDRAPHARPVAQAIPVRSRHSAPKRQRGAWRVEEVGAAAPTMRASHESVLQAVAVPERGVWLPRIIDAAARADLGRPRVLTADNDRHAVLVTNCRSCTDPRRAPGLGCEHERDVLERALREVAPKGRVVEVSCKPKRPGACIFEILPGGGT